MKGTYRAALLLVAVVTPIPIVATFITAILYIILGQQFTPPPPWLNYGALSIGLGATLFIWLFAALFCRSRATARNANKISYDAIIQELRRLEVNYDTINNDANEADETIESEAVITALQTTKTGEVIQISEAVAISEDSNSRQQNDNSGALQRAYYALYGEHENEYIETILTVNGSQWVQASGYIGIWNRLQAADAEMISLLPIETVSGEADYDLSRLQDSTILDSEQWIDTIHKAKTTLANIKNKQHQPQRPATSSTPQVAHGQPHVPTAHAIHDDDGQQSLEKAMEDLLKFSLTSSPLPMDDAHIPKSFAPAFLSLIKKAVTAPEPQSQQTEEQARADLRRARIFINSYISNRWAGLIQSRNLLIGISFYTSIFIYVLFILAIVDNAAPASIFAALVFFIVGAIAGLFPRLAPKTRATSQPAKITKPAKTNSQPAKSKNQSSAANGQSKTTSQSASQSGNQHASSDMKPLSDDYGLTRARVLITPVFSGLAALIGVVLASMLTITLVALTPGPSNTGTPTPTTIVSTTTVTTTTATSAPTAPQGNRSVPNFPSLNEIYSLTTNVQGVIFALVFGFLPSLVIGALQKEAADLQSQLQSTDPGEQGSKK